MVKYLQTRKNVNLINSRAAMVDVYRINSLAIMKMTVAMILMKRVVRRDIHS